MSSRTTTLLASLSLACVPVAESARADAPQTQQQTQRNESVPPEAAPPLASNIELALGERIEQLLAADFLQDAQVGVSIIALPSRQAVYQHEAHLPLNPASNAKLVTSATALATLGPEHRYATKVYSDADALSNGVIASDIYLRGGGDPQLVTGDLYELARALWTDGIRHVRGGVVVDSSRFDADGLPPGFDQKDEFASYRAPIGAASVNFNTFVVEIRPSETIDRPVVVTVNPPVDSVTIKNDAQTAGGKRNRLSVTAEHERGALILSIAGSLGVDGRGPRLRYPVDDPSRYAGEVFRLALTDIGIRVDKNAVRDGSVPPDATYLGRHRSAQLSAQLRAVNKLSNNFMAEQILRTLDPDDGATAEASLQRVHTYLGSIGLPSTGLMIGNGSGLYDNNRITANQLTYLLASVASDFRYAPEFLAALSTMGVDGTAKSRLRDTELERWVRAKTGTLDGVSTLSGYMGTLSGQVFAFAILFNGFDKTHANAARGLQDDIVGALGLASAGVAPTVAPPQ